MSHFPVAVITDGNKTVEKMLAPYQENSYTECPKKYMEFFDTEGDSRIWGAGSIERGIEKYEKLVGVDLTNLYANLDSAANAVLKTMEAIPEDLRPRWAK